MSVDTEYCLDPITQSDCSRNPRPLPNGDSVFFAVLPKFMNVDIRFVNFLFSIVSTCQLIIKGDCSILNGVQFVTEEIICEICVFSVSFVSTCHLIRQGYYSILYHDMAQCEQMCKITPLCRSNFWVFWYFAKFWTSIGQIFIGVKGQTLKKHILAVWSHCSKWTKLLASF